MRKLLLLITLVAVNDLWAISIGEQAPNFIGKTANGKDISLRDFRGKMVVLEWLNHGCPFIKKHYQSGNMQKMQKNVKDKNVIWISVISSAVGKQGFSDAEKAKEDKKKSNSLADHIILDKLGNIGKLYDAKTTPHMFVINTKGELVYQGAIDSIASSDPDDIKSATNYVLNTVDAIRLGKKVNPSKTKPYGCSIKY